MDADFTINGRSFSIRATRYYSDQTEWAISVHEIGPDGDDWPDDGPHPSPHAAFAAAVAAIVTHVTGEPVAHR